MTHPSNHVTESVLHAEPQSGGDATVGFRIRRGAKALVRTPRSVLLVRERHADGTPFWTLPGGGAQEGEPNSATLRRELIEELSCRCTIHGVAGSFWHVHHSLYRTVSVYTIFDCTLLGEPTPMGSEIQDARWFRPSDIPPTTLPGVVTSIDLAIE